MENGFAYREGRSRETEVSEDGRINSGICNLKEGKLTSTTQRIKDQWEKFPRISKMLAGRAGKETAVLGKPAGEGLGKLTKVNRTDNGWENILDMTGERTRV